MGIQYWHWSVENLNRNLIFLIFSPYFQRVILLHQFKFYFPDFLACIFKKGYVYTILQKHRLNMFNALPRGCLSTQSRTFFFIFTQSCTHFSRFHAIIQTCHFLHFHTITHLFFLFSHNLANKKGLFTPSRTTK